MVMSTFLTCGRLPKQGHNIQLVISLDTRVHNLPEQLAPVASTLPDSDQSQSGCAHTCVGSPQTSQGHSATKFGTTDIIVVNMDCKKCGTISSISSTLLLRSPLQIAFASVERSGRACARPK